MAGSGLAPAAMVALREPPIGGHAPREKTTQDDGSRGRLGDGGVSVTMSVGAEAEGAARASAGDCSMLNQKYRLSSEFRVPVS
eukprot:scaffold10540_cov116-Isochrysis_galbana.AAC.11